MADSAAPIRYSIAVPNPESHLAEVTMSIEAAQELADDAGNIVVKMAAWCPGSYLIRDYARFLRDVRAADETGRPLAIRKASKQSWSIATGGAKGVTINYEVYGHDLSVRTNHIEGTHAFLHGPAIFLYSDGARSTPCELEITLPEGREWTIATGLERDSDNRFRAADLDTLFDSPLHLGVTEVRHFEAAGVPFEIAVWGTPAPGVRDLGDLVNDLIPIVEGQAEIFGGLPFDRYTFILMLSPKAYGGLEHKNSSANLASCFAFAKDNSYWDLLELLSHEFFHAWNGKRIYPASFEPFDYEREQYTRCLWVVEGLTSYYDRYMNLRHGPLTARRYLEKLADEWSRLQGTPGRHRHSLESSSFDAWIKLYKPDPSNLNTTVSYYLKGGLTMATLDLWLRRKTDGSKSLDDVLTALWNYFGKTGRGYPEDVEGIFSEAVGIDVGEPFAKWIVGNEDPDLAGELSHVGLGLTGEADKNGLSTYLGVQLGEKPLRITAVLDDSPASRCGISPGDEIAALGGYKVTTAADLRSKLAPLSADAPVEIALFRRSSLVTTAAELAEAPPRAMQIATVSEPSDEQIARFSDWLGESWPSDGLRVSQTTKRWT